MDELDIAQSYNVASYSLLTDGFKAFVDIPDNLNIYCNIWKCSDNLIKIVKH